MLETMQNTTPGDSVRWTTKGQCSLGVSCAFKHDPNKKGKGKGRPRSPSRTGSPHRNMKGDGKCSDDGNAKGIPKLTGQSPSAKLNRLPCMNFKTGSCQKGICVIIIIFLNVQDSNLKPDASSETSVFTDTQLNLLLNKNATIAIHIATNDERQMQLRKISRMTRPNSE